MNIQPEPNKDVPMAGEIPEVQPPLLSSLPPEVQANIALDKKSFAASNNPPPMQPTSPQPKKISGAGKFVKLALIPFVVVICFVIALLLVDATNLDSSFLKISLVGKVTDSQSNNAINNAQLFINNAQVATTNQNGEYKIDNLSPGKVTVTIKADGYKDDTEDVVVTRLLLDYSSTKDFILTQGSKSSLSGKFISNLKNYNFNDDKLLINDTRYTIANDGTFTVDNINTGDIKLSFQSINFKDFDQKITVNPGKNQIDDIQLQPAGDIDGDLSSWIREDLVLNTKFFIENVLQDQIIITDDGKYLIKDLDVNKTYKIRVVADGYNTKDYEIKIAQGENKIFNFKLVEEGSAVFFTPGEGSNAGVQIGKSDFDGSNFDKLTSDPYIDTVNSYYNPTEKLVYYMTRRDSISGNGIGQISIPYTVDITTKQTQKLTTNTDNLGTLTTNFIAKTMVSQVSDGTNYNLVTMDLSGNNRTTIATDTQSYDKIVISDNGKAFAFTQNKNGQTQLYEYLIDSNETKTIATSSKINLYDISSDGSFVLFSRINSNTGLEDLVMFTYSGNDIRILKENHDGQQYKFIKDNTNKIVYFASRDGRSNVYTFTIDQNKDERLTSLSSDFSINGVYQQSGYLNYPTNKGLYILDLNKPKNFKLVTDKLS